MKTVTILQSKNIANILNIDLNIIPINEWKYGMQVEMEHGKHNKLTNVTNDNLLITGKIALAHILEYPDYYKRHKIMEQNAHKYWSKRKKNNIIKPKRSKSKKSRSKYKKSKSKSKRKSKSKSKSKRK